MADQATRLERDIFGASDSELSSDDEPRHIQRRSPPHRRPAAAAAAGTSGSEDNFVEDRPEGVRKSKPSRTAKLPRKRRKRDEGQQEEVDTETPLTEEQLRRLQLNQTIDAAIKPARSRPKKRKKDDEELLDHFADEEVARLKETMLRAAAEDVESNIAKQAATAKLKHLAEVTEVLQKSSLMQSIIDNNLLEGVRKWLEPLPDKSLPALNIQKELFEAVSKMYVDTNTLKDSGLGKVVLFYTRCKRVTPAIKRAADNLIEVWSRPIIKRSASYRDRAIPTVALESNTKHEKLSVILARAQESEAGKSKKNGVRIPTRDFGTYTVAPKVGSSQPATGDRQNSTVDAERKRAQQERLRKMNRKLALHAQKSSRM